MALAVTAGASFLLQISKDSESAVKFHLYTLSTRKCG